MNRFSKTKDVEAESSVKEIDILRLLAAFWHHIWIIVIVALLCGAIAFVYAYFFITPTYQSSAMMYVNNGSLIGGTTVNLSDLTASKNLVDTYIVLLKTRQTLEAVIDRAGVDLTYEQLNPKISASAVNSTEVFRVTVTDVDPERATLIANTTAAVLQERVEHIVNGSTAVVVDQAVVPAGKSAPSLTKYTAIGLILGVVASCAVIVVLELMDDQVRDESFLTQNYSLPILASIPDLTANVTGKAYKYGRYSKYGKYGKRYYYGGGTSTGKDTDREKEQKGGAKDGEQ